MHSSRGEPVDGEMSPLLPIKIENEFMKPLLELDPLDISHESIKTEITDGKGKNLNLNQITSNCLLEISFT